MTALVIDNEVRRQIAQAIALAEKNPLALERVVEIASHIEQSKQQVDLTDVPDAAPRSPVVGVEIPIGYRVALSIEEQPAGLCKHLSVSVERKGAMPSISAIELICSEYGMEFRKCQTWVEEFDPGHHAINLVYLYKPRGKLQ